MDEKIEGLRTELSNLHFEVYEIRKKIDENKMLLEKEYIDKAVREIVDNVSNPGDDSTDLIVSNIIEETVRKIKSLNL